MTTPNTLARIAGVFYLLLIGAAFNEGYVLSHLVKRGDATATADNIRASATPFRLGFMGDLTAATFWLLTAMALYLLLQHVNQLAAAAMVTFAAVGAAVMTLNQLNGYVIDDMFFGLWLLPLGYLVIRSGYFPKVLGVLLIVGCFGYLVSLFTVFLAPGLGTVVTFVITVPAAAAGELTFLLWLLVRGVQAPAPPARVPGTPAPSISSSPRRRYPAG
jgi:hypothetical protein